MKCDQIMIPSSLGRISANLYKSGLNDKSLAILCPGFLDSKDYLHLTKLAEVLIKFGYDAVSFDPTGTWGSEGGIADYTMTQYLFDITKVIEYMMRNSQYSQILIAGHSRGGQMAILHAARDSRISGVIGIMPSFGRYEGEFRKRWEKSGVLIEKRDHPHDPNLSVNYKVPFAHALDRDKFDALEDIAKLNVPVLLIAGENDENVTPEDVEELYIRAKEPKRFIIVNGVGHEYRKFEDQVELVNHQISKNFNDLFNE